MSDPMDPGGMWHGDNAPDEPSRLEGHINAAEYWIMQADNWEFPNPIRTGCLQLAAIHASLAQALSAAPAMVRDAAVGG